MLKSLDPIKPLMFGFSHVNVIVVGAGGTGGYLLQSLARLLVHLGKPETIAVVALDGDVVEEKNVGRQLFSYSEIGRNKAETLIRRFNMAFGLHMVAAPHMASYMALIGMFSSIHETARFGTHANIVVGCVDTTEARRIIDLAITSAGSGNEHPTYWLDCGNNDHSGQVLFGNARKSQLGGSLSTGFCTALPLPSDLYPELIEPAPVLDIPVNPANCAVDLLQNRQSLNINQTIATIAAQYIHNLLVDRRLNRYQTMVDLSTMDMQSLTITPTNVAKSIGINPELLTKKGR